MTHLFLSCMTLVLESMLRLRGSKYTVMKEDNKMRELIVVIVIVILYLGVGIHYFFIK